MCQWTTEGDVSEKCQWSTKGDASKLGCEHVAVAMGWLGSDEWWWAGLDCWAELVGLDLNRAKLGGQGHWMGWIVWTVKTWDEPGLTGNLGWRWAMGRVDGPDQLDSWNARGRRAWQGRVGIVVGVWAHEYDTQKHVSSIGRNYWHMEARDAQGRRVARAAEDSCRAWRRVAARTSVILADLSNSVTSKLIERLWWRAVEGPDPLGGECNNRWW
jgi:hypothetical protein